MTKNEALKMAKETLTKWGTADDELACAIVQTVRAIDEALARPSNMVTVPADQLEKMQQELKQLRAEHKKWQGFARRAS